MYIQESSCCESREDDTSHKGVPCSACDRGWWCHHKRPLHTDGRTCSSLTLRDSIQAEEAPWFERCRTHHSLRQLDIFRTPALAQEALACPIQKVLDLPPGTYSHKRVRKTRGNGSSCSSLGLKSGHPREALPRLLRCFSGTGPHLGALWPLPPPRANRLASQAPRKW